MPDIKEFEFHYVWVPGTTLKQMKLRAFEEVLKFCGGSTYKAAKILDVSRRTVDKYKLKIEKEKAK